MICIIICLIRCSSEWNKFVPKSDYFGRKESAAIHWIYYLSSNKCSRWTQAMRNQLWVVVAVLCEIKCLRIRTPVSLLQNNRRVLSCHDWVIKARMSHATLRLRNWRESRVNRSNLENFCTVFLCQPTHALICPTGFHRCPISAYKRRAPKLPKQPCKISGNFGTVGFPHIIIRLKNWISLRSLLGVVLVVNQFTSW